MKQDTCIVCAVIALEKKYPSSAPGTGAVYTLAGIGAFGLPLIIDQLCGRHVIAVDSVRKTFAADASIAAKA